VSDWQPISTAPKDGTWVLLYSQHDGIRIGNWDRIEWADDGDGVALEPTHWMPLPEPPK
jgi:hypothetical protein